MNYSRSIESVMLTSGQNIFEKPFDFYMYARAMPTRWGIFPQWGIPCGELFPCFIPMQSLCQNKYNYFLQ